MGFADTYGALLFLVFLSGVGSSAYHPVAVALVAREVPDQRGFGLGLFKAGGDLGSVFTPAVVAWLTVLMSDDWRTAAQWMVLPGLVWVVLVALRFKDTAPSSEPLDRAAAYELSRFDAIELSQFDPEPGPDASDGFVFLSGDVPAGNDCFYSPSSFRTIRVRHRRGGLDYDRLLHFRNGKLDHTGEILGSIPAHFLHYWNDGGGGLGLCSDSLFRLGVDAFSCSGPTGVQPRPISRPHSRRDDRSRRREKSIEFGRAALYHERSRRDGFPLCGRAYRSEGGAPASLLFLLGHCCNRHRGQHSGSTGRCASAWKQRGPEAFHLASHAKEPSKHLIYITLKKEGGDFLNQYWTDRFR